MNIANKNIKIRYWRSNYYVLKDNGSFQRIRDCSVVAKNCGRASSNERMAIGVPVNWDIPIVNESFGHSKVHDWYSVAIKSSTDSFVNQYKFDECNYANDSSAKYPV